MVVHQNNTPAGVYSPQTAGGGEAQRSYLKLKIFYMLSLLIAAHGCGHDEAFPVCEPVRRAER